MSSSNGSGTAPDAAVDTGHAPAQQDYLDAYAAERDSAVTAIEGKLAGMKESLASAKDEAKRARAAARKGGTE